MKKFFGWYLFAFVCGIFSGKCLSKASYYQGQLDAYEEVENLFKDAIENEK